MSLFPDFNCEFVSGLTTFMFIVCNRFHIICLLLTCVYTMYQYNMPFSFISVSTEKVEIFCGMYAYILHHILSPVFQSLLPNAMDYLSIYEGQR